MKKCFLVLPLLLLLVLPSAAPAQIPNPGFESWYTIQGLPATSFFPTGWYLDNSPGLFEPVSRSSAPHTGTYALQGAIVAAPILLELVPPVVQSWFPYTGRPGALTGYISFTSAGRDSLVIGTVLYKTSLSQVVAVGDWGTATSTTGYTKFSIPLEYFSTDAPDTTWIYITIDPGDADTVHLGTVFLLDDLAYEGQATGIAAGSTKPATFALNQNYPNPFNPSTTIRFELPEASQVRLTVYNLLGQEVKVLANDQRQAGVYDLRFDAAGLPSGTYFYRLEARSTDAKQGENFVQVRKMSIVK
jgi:hypothetical protein